MKRVQQLFLVAATVLMANAAHGGEADLAIGVDFTWMVGIGLLAVALLFVWRSFYSMRIPKEDLSRAQTSGTGLSPVAGATAAPVGAGSGH